MALRKLVIRGTRFKITLLNAEGDQSKISNHCLNNWLMTKNDVVIGIATPAAQGLAAATKDIPVIMGAISDPVGQNWLRISSIQKAMLPVPLTKCRLSRQ